MKIFLLGGTGLTGRILLDECLKISRGFEVTAFVRDSSKIKENDEKLRVVQGDPATAESLQRALIGHDAVVCALGYRKPKQRQRVFEPAIEAIVKAGTHAGIKQIVYLSAYGVAETRGDLGFLLGKLILPMMLEGVFADHATTEKIIRSSGIDYTIVRPGMLTNGPRTGSYRAQEGLMKARKISRADVADFMLRSLSDPSFSRKTIGLSY
jgi:uncharacterized protein YbjT (DUF2867 family)